MFEFENDQVVFKSDDRASIVLNRIQVAAIKLIIKKCIEEELHRNQ